MGCNGLGIRYMSFSFGSIYIGALVRLIWIRCRARVYTVRY
jgi:hypothetical protein